MTYFISDTHFGHDREFIYRPRGFENLKDMEETIIKNWNSTVSEVDDIYVLGDFFLGTDLDHVRSILSQLSGNIHLILGNHDTPNKCLLYTSFPKIKEIVYATCLQYNKRTYYLSHYPTLTANLDSNPQTVIINLFGHTHSKKKFFEERPYMYNVSCDAQGCKPVSISDIEKEIKQELKKCLVFL